MTDTTETWTEDALVSYIGAGIHTALRRACDSDASTVVYYGIRGMDDGEWAGVVRYMATHLADKINAGLVIDK